MSSLPAGVLPTVHQGSRLNPGASKPSSEGGSRTSPSVSGFLQPSIPRPEGFGVVAPHHRSVDLNDYITSSHFHMETPQSVLRSICPGDWMISLDLQDAYLQVPVHHDSRHYLRFVVAGKSYQFRVLCFGLTTAPQVFMRIMAQCPPSSTGTGSGCFVTWTIGSSWPLQKSPAYHRGTGSYQFAPNLASRSTSRSRL